MWRDAAAGIALIVVAGLYWLGADQIRVSTLEGAVGAQAVPKSLAVALALLAVLMMAQAAWQRHRAAAAGGGRITSEERRRHLRALGMLLIGVGYLLLVGLLGYVLAIGLLMLATATYIGRPVSPPLVSAAALGALLYYLLFVWFLDIPLPAGIWPDVWRSLAA